MNLERTLTLEQFQEKYRIKRIDFNKVKDCEEDTQYGSDRLICPYCEGEFEYESEEIQDILGGEPYQCPCCEKWFYVEGEVSIDTYCYPMEKAVLEHRSSIEGSYKHMDECAEKGLLFEPNRYGIVEWEVYSEFARPYFENIEKDTVMAEC